VFAVKIIDPTLRDAHFGRLVLEPSHDGRPSGDVFSLSLDGVLVGELAPTGPASAAAELGEEDTNVVEQGNCWTLGLTDEDGRVWDSHVLCVAATSGRGTHELTGGIAVWATLTVLCVAGARVRQDG